MANTIKGYMWDATRDEAVEEARHFREMTIAHDIRFQNCAIHTGPNPYKGAQGRKDGNIFLKILTFQCVRVGRPVTSPRCSFFIHSFWALSLISLDWLSMVERRLIGSESSFRLSREPCTLRGGVMGDDFWGRSVGRRAAGT